MPIPVQAAPAAAVYVPKGKPAAKKFKVGEHGVLGFDLPRGWNYRPYRTSPLIPASFRLDAPDGSAAMIVSISWDGIGTGKEAPDEQLLERKLRNEAEKRIRTSVEKTVEVKTVILDDGHVQYAQFTQAMWVNAEVPKGNYRYSTDGVFRCGNLWGAITVYSQDKTGDSFRPALEVIKSFRKLDR
ncbi:MAG TPA: hypothetical protein VGH19_14135 [Verrucomicrobiae bacterium]